MMLLLFFKAWDLVYGRTDHHVTIKIFEIDGLPKFTKVRGSARTPSARRSSAIN